MRALIAARVVLPGRPQSLQRARHVSPRLVALRAQKEDPLDVPPIESLEDQFKFLEEDYVDEVQLEEWQEKRLLEEYAKAGLVSRVDGEFLLCFGQGLRMCFHVEHLCLYLVCRLEGAAGRSRSLPWLASSTWTAARC